MVLNKRIIGEFRSIVVFSVNNPSKGASISREAVVTGQNDQYSVILTTRGRLRKDNGSRDLSFGLVAGNDTYTLECRYESGMSTIKVNGKLTVDGVQYTIATIDKVDQINHIIKFRINTQTVA